MDIRLDGKKALITGASRGMGRGMALKFSESGAEVGIVARRPEVLEETKREMEAATGGKVFAYSCDMGDAEAIKTMWASALDDLGQIDILVNNAGTSTRGPFEEISDEMWEEDLGLKLFGAIRTCRLAFPAMKARRWGRIINVVTVAGKGAACGQRAHLGIARRRHGDDQGAGGGGCAAQRAGERALYGTHRDGSNRGAL